MAHTLRQTSRGIWVCSTMWDWWCMDDGCIYVQLTMHQWTATSCRRGVPNQPKPIRWPMAMDREDGPGVQGRQTTTSTTSVVIRTLYAWFEFNFLMNCRRVDRVARWTNDKVDTNWQYVSGISDFRDLDLERQTRVSDFSVELHGMLIYCTIYRLSSRFKIILYLILHSWNKITFTISQPLFIFWKWYDRFIPARGTEKPVFSFNQT